MSWDKIVWRAILLVVLLEAKCTVNSEEQKKDKNSDDLPVTKDTKDLDKVASGWQSQGRPGYGYQGYGSSSSKGSPAYTGSYWSNSGDQGLWSNYGNKRGWPDSIYGTNKGWSNYDDRSRWSDYGGLGGWSSNYGGNRGWSNTGTSKGWPSYGDSRGWYGGQGANSGWYTGNRVSGTYGPYNRGYGGGYGGQYGSHGLGADRGLRGDKGGYGSNRGWLDSGYGNQIYGSGYSSGSLLGSTYGNNKGWPATGGYFGQTGGWYAPSSSSSWGQRGDSGSYQRTWPDLSWGQYSGYSRGSKGYGTQGTGYGSTGWASGNSQYSKGWK